jgi:hypothetical protein
MIEDRDVQADRFPRQNLDHETGGSGAAAGRATDLVVIGLIAEHATESILRDGQTHELEGREGASRSDRLHIRRVLIHGAAGSERIGQGPEVVASSRSVGGMQRLLIGT